MPLVSVIVNCHNSRKYLRQALDSIYQQTFTDYEIVFWDNQSSDFSGEIALSYGEPLRYFRGDTFLSLGAARNAAIEKARGEYIAFLDCDDIWLPDKLEQQVRLLDSDEGPGLVYSDCYLIDGDGNPRKNTYFDSYRPFRGYVFNELLFNDFVPLLTAVIRKEVLNMVGVFNPGYEIAEEYDLWLRIARHYHFDFCEQPLAKYRIHDGSISSARQAEMFGEVFQILEYWMSQPAVASGELRRKLKQRKAFLHTALMLHYFKNHENRKGIRESLSVAGSFPYSLVETPRVLAGMARTLLHSL
jgi:glycosyltransferase involved in cell wall biosynthesis